MRDPVRVFTLLGESALRHQVQKRWRSNGIAMCAMHAEGGESLVEELGRLRPQVVVADADVDGARDLVQAAARRFRIPTLCLVRAQGASALRPFEWGAVDILARSDDLDRFVAEIEAAIHASRGAQVVEQLDSVFPLSGAFPDASVFDLRRALRGLGAADKLVVVGAGLGGPMAMRRILATLRGQECSPIVYVQHFAASLLDPLAAWLETHTGAQVERAATGQVLEAGRVYVAGHAQEVVRLERSGDRTLLRLAAPNGDARHLDALLISAACLFGARSVGVLLSGHGDDGSAGLRRLRDSGGLTIAQDRASSPQYELPGAARDAGGAIECLPINEIAERLRMLMQAEHAARS
jgi:two-component system chemotaxis response regulator CheB